MTTVHQYRDAISIARQQLSQIADDFEAIVAETVEKPQTVDDLTPEIDRLTAKRVTLTTRIGVLEGLLAAAEEQAEAERAKEGVKAYVNRGEQVRSLAAQRVEIAKKLQSQSKKWLEVWDELQSVDELVHTLGHSLVGKPYWSGRVAAQPVFVQIANAIQSGHSQQGVSPETEMRRQADVLSQLITEAQQRAGVEA